jgi:starch phosphorylase
MRAIRRFTVRPVLPERLSALDDLAGNLRWSWHPETRDVFQAISPSLWHEVGGDPVRLLGEVGVERFEELASDTEFLHRMDAAADDLRNYLAGARWSQTLGEASPSAIGYFSPEFGVAAALPQYSGGLGILAGDHLKAASDLGVPIIGVGLFYHSGYFRQSLNRDGWQEERYPVLDPDGMPVSLLRDRSGAAAIVAVGLPGGRFLHAHIWVAQVGRVPLLLLDSEVELNGPAEREVTDRLYGGAEDHRLRQEMLLGIGGVRAIRAYCEITGHAAPEVFHTNEGHAGFLGLERIREFIGAGLTLEQAVQVARAGTVFTTHTPVPAGIDRFPRSLIEHYFGGDNAVPGVPVDFILSLGAEDYEGGDSSVFNMAIMGFRLAQRANGVSLLHGQVSRRMFSGLWPGFDEEEVPITSITNGVHAPTWVAREIRDLAVREVPAESLEEPESWDAIARVPERDLWQAKFQLRDRLVVMVRQRLHESWANRGASPAEVGWIDDVLRPDILTIGFARRVPSYKRLTLMMRDRDRLTALLTDPERPVQLVIAGKAHPADEGGKALIQKLVQFTDEADVRHRIVFLPDYDISMATTLYPGCDVWLNNPLRPLEACGTSGMKAALNGALNLSILDGWWDEWCDGKNGWAIPTADGVDDPDRRDDLEAAALYDLIENKVAPLFYDRGVDDVPYGWVEMLRHNLRSLGPKVLARRMVRDYVNLLYVPAAESSRAMSARGFTAARELAEWKARVVHAWPSVRVDHVQSEDVASVPTLGMPLKVHALVCLGGLSPDDVDVQLVHGRVDVDDRIVSPGTTALTACGAEGETWRFEAQVELDRTGPFGYTVRVLPRHGGLASPVEMGLLCVPVGGAV